MVEAMGKGNLVKDLHNRRIARNPEWRRSVLLSTGEKYGQKAGNVFRSPGAAVPAAPTGVRKPTGGNRDTERAGPV